jgi:hypothetical protein
MIIELKVRVRIRNLFGFNRLQICINCKWSAWNVKLKIQFIIISTPFIYRSNFPLKIKKDHLIQRITFQNSNNLQFPNNSKLISLQKIDFLDRISTNQIVQWNIYGNLPSLSINGELLKVRTDLLSWGEEYTENDFYRRREFLKLRIQKPQGTRDLFATWKLSRGA